MDKLLFIKHMLRAKLGALLVGSGVVFGIWYLGFLAMDSHVLPNPVVVFRHLPTIMNETMWLHLRHSFLRVLMGLVVSMSIGLAMGILAAQNKWLAKILNPFIYFTYPIPRVALLPVVMLLFGMGDTSKVIMISMIVVYPIIIVVRDSVADIPKDIDNALTCYGASRVDVFFSITLPWAFSAILSTLRISLGTAIAILFFTETYGTRFGMGFFILDAWMRISYVQMYGGIVLLSLSGYVLFMVIDLLEDYLLRWKKG